jgi:hypothetical protein
MQTELDSYRRKAIEEEHDTFGFPRVCGMPPSAYATTKLPENLEECEEMLSDLYYLIGDITTQLENASLAWSLRKLEESDFNKLLQKEKENLAWRINANHKRRLLRQQLCLLTKWKEHNKQKQKTELEKLSCSLNKVVEELEQLKRKHYTNSKLTSKLKKTNERFDNEIQYLVNFVARALWTIATGGSLSYLLESLGFVKDQLEKNDKWGSCINPPRDSCAEETCAGETVSS